MKHRIRVPIHPTMVVHKDGKFKFFLVFLAIIFAYTIGSLHVFTSYAPPSGQCSASIKEPSIYVQSIPPDVLEKVSERISEKFSVDRDFAKEVVNMATATQDRTFPRAEDILAIVAVESGFNPRAVNAGAYGLMQIQFSHHKTKAGSIEELFDPLNNMKVGSSILKEYFHLVGRTKEGTVLAYQAGIGGYLNGTGQTAYLAKFERERAWFKKVLKA